MPYLDRVAHRPLRIHLELRAALHPRLALARQLCGRLRIVWQQLQKSFEAVGVVPEAGRELPQQRPEFFLEVEQARGQKVGQRSFNV